VVTGADTQKAVGKTIGMISMAAPYGGGAFLSLFRRRSTHSRFSIAMPTEVYTGAIFTMAVGTAEEIKEAACGTRSPYIGAGRPSAAQAPTANSSSKEQKQ